MARAALTTQPRPPCTVPAVPKDPRTRAGPRDRGRSVLAGRPTVRAPWIRRIQRAHHLPASARVDTATGRAAHRLPVLRRPGHAPAHSEGGRTGVRARRGRAGLRGGPGRDARHLGRCGPGRLRPLGARPPGPVQRRPRGPGRHDRRARPDVFNAAAAIYRSTAFRHVPLSQRRAGDLVFWGSDLHHMALYLGRRPDRRGGTPGRPRGRPVAARDAAADRRPRLPRGPRSGSHRLRGQPQRGPGRGGSGAIRIWRRSLAGSRPW